MGVRLKTTDPIWWGLFSAGGTVAAFLVPVHILVTGLGIGLGWIPIETLSYERVQELLENPLVRLYLLVLISLPLFHAAHRLRHILIDLGGGAVRTPISVLCYGSAIAGTAAAVWLLV
ncbi:MAG: fumarate reductase subunit D [Candidatus Aminicenantes bacterium]|nr:fumarate reductase subunit D [Candidatus Aminicenantes bacterium]